MSKNYTSFWGVPEKMKKLFEGHGDLIPEIHFLFTINETNVQQLLKDPSKMKVVLLTLFPEDE